MSLAVIAAARSTTAVPDPAPAIAAPTLTLLPPPRLTELLEQRLHHELLLSDFDLLREVTRAATALTVGLALLLLTWREVRRRSLVVQLFDVAPSLAAQGWSGQVVARRFHDQLVHIRVHAATSMETRALTRDAAGAENDISLPGMHISLSSVFAYLRAALGRDTYVDGEITERDGRVTVAVRVRGQSKAGFTGTVDGFDDLLLASAEHVFLYMQPYVLAAYRRDRGDLHGAIAALGRSSTARDRTERSRALVMWGKILHGQGDVTGAESKFRTAMSTSPTDVWPYENLMLLLTFTARAAEAEQVVRQFIRRKPRPAVGYSLLAQYRHYVSQPGGPAALFQRALRRDNKDLKAWQGKIYCELYRHDYAAALALIDRATRIALKQNEHTLGGLDGHRAWAHCGLRNFAIAGYFARQLCEQHPAMHNGWARLGQVQLAQHQYLEAIVSLERAVSIGLESQLASALLVRALSQAGRHDAAIASIQRTLACNPCDVPVLIAWGDLLLGQGDAAAAHSRFHRAAELAPDYAEVHEGIGRALAMQGDSVGALTRFEQAAKCAPKWAAPHLAWGDVLAARGDATGAVAHYEKALARDPGWAIPHAHWGALLERQGNVAAAGARYHRAYQLDPANPALAGLSPGQQEPAPRN